MNNQLFNRPSLLAGLASLIVAAAIGLSSCSKSSEGGNVAPAQTASNPITGTNLAGTIKGTLLTGTTYTVTGDVTVGKKDTLFVQRGVTINVTNDATFYVQGTLISEGSQTAPIYFTSPSKKYGSWGGFQCDSANYVRIQWTHVDYTGGPDPTGSPRKTLYVNKPIPVIIQDSWFLGGQDDGLRLQNGCTIDLQRNTIEAQGSTDGEAINVKGGATGVIAYNVVWSTAGSAIKVETSTTQLFPQTSVKVYNNTVISNGFRRGAAEPGRGVLFDNFAKGEIYNNLIVNNYEGLDISPVADTKNIAYGNNYFYATIDSLRQFYYPKGSFGVQQPTDIISMSTTDKDPMLMKFDANPNSPTDANDAHLQAGSPALGKGNTVYNKDIGAYTSDGNGNKH